MLLFVLTLFIGALTHDHCVYPFIFHNFTNCPEMQHVPRRTNEQGFGEPIVNCENEGTWGCPVFEAIWPFPEDGYVGKGAVYFNKLDCCTEPDIKTIETVIKVREDICDGKPFPPEPRRNVECHDEEFEVEVYNIKLAGSQGNCEICDSGYHGEYCEEIEECYDFDHCTGNLMHIAMVLDYCDVPNRPVPPNRTIIVGSGDCSEDNDCNHGSCFINSPRRTTEYTPPSACLCDLNWGGSHCDIPLDDGGGVCNHDDEEVCNHGYCYGAIAKRRTTEQPFEILGVCKCDPDWAGDYCDIPLIGGCGCDQYNHFACNEYNDGGYCAPSGLYRRELEDHDGVCICNEGWYGCDCEKRIYANKHCDMKLKLFIDGELIINTTSLVMDKMFSPWMDFIHDMMHDMDNRRHGGHPDFIVALVRNMFEVYLDDPEPFDEYDEDELHFVRLWDVNLPDSVIKENAMKWMDQTAQDGYCDEEEEEEDCYTTQLMSDKAEFRENLWLALLIIIAIVVFSCIVTVIGSLLLSFFVGYARNSK